MSDGAQRIVVNCGGPGPLPSDLPDELVAGLRDHGGAQHARLADTNSTNILADGSLGKGVEDVTIDAAKTMTQPDRGEPRRLRPGVRNGPQAQPDARQRRQGAARRRPADPRAEAGSANRRLMPCDSIWRRRSRSRPRPTAWARSSARAACRRGISAAAAAASRSRKACGSTAAASRSATTQLVVVGEISAHRRRNRLAVPPRQLRGVQ